jgi:hypothetical protein
MKSEEDENVSVRPMRLWPARILRIVGAGLVMTCASAAVSLAQSGNPVARRGAPLGPVSEVTVSVGGLEYSGRVDASCQIDEKATTSNTRAYFVVMYPWLGQRPPADQPQWRFTLEIRRHADADTYPQFAFSFLDGAKPATIQTVGGSPKMGSGSVRVTRRGPGARFEVEGRSKEGQPLRAAIDCPRFQATAAAGG